MRVCTQLWVLQAFGHGKYFLAQPSRQRQYPSCDEEMNHPVQRTEMRGRICPDPPTQFERPRSSMLGLRSAQTADCQQRCDSSDLQCEFLLVALSLVRQCLEKLDAAAEMRDRFDIGRARDRPLAGAVPVRDRLFGQSRVASTEMVEIRRP